MGPKKEKKLLNRVQKWVDMGNKTSAILRWFKNGASYFCNQLLSKVIAKILFPEKYYKSLKIESFGSTVTFNRI
jgi:predicted YcjX-like family ATPase